MKKRAEMFQEKQKEFIHKNKLLETERMKYKELQNKVNNSGVINLFP
jgi:hypothetical protein